MSKQERAVAALTQCVNSVEAFITKEDDGGAAEEVEVDRVRTHSRRS